ncbi:putative polyol transporter 1 [Syzygium oleosum]|uniref:putative polyol transporter 1 n=1 Tax=Syzygium oleosum TaxID=219896 RepID=UPI0024BB9A21|nr:putative polyol transporter 1 [Syzygium oleosum]
MASEQPVCLSKPFGEDESFVPFLLRLFGGGEDDEDDVLALSEPFGKDESFVPFLLRLFGGGEDDEDGDVLALSEPFGEDESFVPFLLRLFGGGEEDEDADVLALSEPFGEDESFVPFLLRLFGGGEDDEDEDMLAPAARVSEIEEEVHIEASDGSHQSQTESNRDENDDDQHIRQGTIEDFHPPARSVCKKHVCLYTLAACITSFSLAYVQAAISGSVAYMKIDLKVSDLHLNIVAGAMSVATMFGLVMARWISDRYGRRNTIVVAGAMYFVGPLVMGFARNYAVFLVGQVIANLGAGFASMIAPMYVTEISPLFSRGFYASCPQMFIGIGNQVANLTSYYFSKHRPSRGWRWMLATGAVPSVLLVFGIFALPESPQWLVMRGRLRDAKRILAKTSRSEEEATLRFADIKKAAGIPEEFDDDAYTIADQDTGACGMDTLALFSPKVLETVGITMSVGKLLANMVLDIAKILVSWAVEVSAILYVIFFSIGLGPITDVYCTEIIPLRMRAQV